MIALFVATRSHEAVMTAVASAYALLVGCLLKLVMTMVGKLAR